jgi:hypothetical protein
MLPCKQIIESPLPIDRIWETPSILAKKERQRFTETSCISEHDAMTRRKEKSPLVFLSLSSNMCILSTLRAFLAHLDRILSTVLVNEHLPNRCCLRPLKLTLRLECAQTSAPAPTALLWTEVKHMWIFS